MADDPRTAESPGPSPSPSPSPSARRSAKGSSRGSSTAHSAFVSEPGPAFDPDRTEPGPEPAGGEPEGATIHVLPEPALEWEVDSVSDILTAQGQAAHSLFGVGEADWVYTEADLMTIARPLTRILNRYPVTRAAAGTGDELAVMIGFGGYIGRSYGERRQVLEAQAEAEAAAEPEPITGVAAEPGTGPPEESTEGSEGPAWKTAT